MATRRFLILHGLANRRPPGHWHHWLAERLRSAGEQVVYLQLPDPDEPDLRMYDQPGRRARDPCRAAASAAVPGGRAAS